jgi:hypothetical protein
MYLTRKADVLSELKPEPCLPGQTQDVCHNRGNRPLIKTRQSRTLVESALEATLGALST